VSSLSTTTRNPPEPPSVKSRRRRLQLQLRVLKDSWRTDW
jgi:hypothetical protein